MKHYPNGPVYVENADGSVAGFAEDLFKPFSDLLNQPAAQQATQSVQNLFASDDLKEALERVDRDVQAAIAEQSSKNATNLFLLAVAGGAIGSTFLRGTTGLLIAGGLALYAATNMAKTPKEK